MLPIKIRQEAGRYASTHKDASIVSAFLAGFQYAQQQPYLDATMVDDTPVYDDVEGSTSALPADFDTIWQTYDRKDNKQSALKAWQRLSHNEQQRAFAHIPSYVRAHPDKKFRPMLSTYLNQKRFNDEEIIDNGNTATTLQQQRLSAYADAIRKAGQ